MILHRIRLSGLSAKLVGQRPTRHDLTKAIASAAMSTDGNVAKTSQKGDYVARQVLEDCIDMSVGQPSPAMLPLQALATAASHRLGSPDAELLLQYGPRQGYRSFRQSLATFLSARYGTAVHADHLMMTAGVSHGLDLAVRSLSRPGELVVVEQPTYFLVTPIFRDNHLTVVPVQTDEYGMVVDELERWLRADPSHRPRLLYTIPIHNNPRGTTLPPHRRRQLLRLAAEFDFVVLADEVYQLLTFRQHDEVACGGGGDESGGSISDGDGGNGSRGGGAAAATASGEGPVPMPMRCYEEGDPRVSRVVSFGSFSKMLAPALRLGWVETPNTTILERLRANGVISSGGCIAQLSTGLAHSALELGLQAEHLDGTVRPQLAARCAALVSALRRRLPPGCCGSLLQPRGGYFVWLELPSQVDTRQLLQLAERSHGVRFTPGPVCGGGPPNCLRLSFSFYSPQELEEGARRLGAAVGEYLGLGLQPLEGQAQEHDEQKQQQEGQERQQEQQQAAA